MATTIGMGAKKKETKSDDKLKAKIVELEKENTELIKEVEKTQKEVADMLRNFTKLHIEIRKENNE